MGITMFVSLYTTRVVLNALGTSDYGIFNLVGGTIALLGFINGSMASATQRFMSYAEGEGIKERQISIFNVSTILHFVLGFFAFFAFAIAGYFFFNWVLVIPEDRAEAAVVVYGSLVISTVFTIISVPYEAVLNAHENMKYYAFVGILESFLKLIVAYACVYTLLDKLIVYGILMALIPIFTLSIMRIYCHKYYQECVISPRQYYDRTVMKEMTSFAGWSFLSSVASITTMQGMAILLNMFGGVIVNTAHGIANQLAGQLLVFSNNMLKALNPVLVKSEGAGDTQRMLGVATTGNKLSFTFYAVFAIPFIVETPYILNIWLGQVPSWTVIFVRLVLFRQILSQLTSTFSTCIFATGKIRNMIMVSSLIWSFPLILSFFLYKMNFPIYTIYLLLVIMEFLHNLNRMYFCKKQCGLDVIKFISQSYLPSCLVIIITIMVLYIIHISLLEGFMRFSLVFFVGILIFLILIYFIVFDTKEKNVVHSFYLYLSTIIKEII